MVHETGLWNRRQFLASLTALGAATYTRPLTGWGASPTRKLKLGFDNFSIRAFGWQAPRLIDYASELKVDTLLLSDLDVYESLEEDYLRQIRTQARRAGIEVQAGTGSICPTSNAYNEKKWGKAEDHARLLIRTARDLGTSVARCYLGTRRDREGDGGIYRHIDETVKVLKAVKSEAEDANVKFAIENHAGDMQAWELASLIEAAGSSYVGATIDAGNAAWTLEDPMVNLELLGPYGVTAGVRDTAIWETDTGASCMWTNMGQGVVDWPAYVKRFQELCPQAAFVLEVISYKWSADLPYLKPDFWSRFPRARAHEFARFVALAKAGRQHQIPSSRPAGPASKELEQAQQKFDLEASLAYCRKKLGVGLK
jgi:sugar phosphate isomerase/epimerase